LFTCITCGRSCSLMAPQSIITSRQKVKALVRYINSLVRVPGFPCNQNVEISYTTHRILMKMIIVCFMYYMYIWTNIINARDVKIKIPWKSKQLIWHCLQFSIANILKLFLKITISKKMVKENQQQIYYLASILYYYYTKYE